MAIRSHPKEKKTSILDANYDIIKNLLIQQNTQVFFYKIILRCNFCIKNRQTDYSLGKGNAKSQQFSNDYGFKVKPCSAGNLWSKGKVETTMKLWDELYDYNVQFSYNELNNKVQEICERHNSQMHSEIGKIPILHIQKEKDFLTPLSQDQIRNLY